MKNNKIVYTVLLLLTVWITGCKKEDLIDLKPEFALDALNNPSSIKQVEEVLLGAYAGFRNSAYFNSTSGTGSGWALMPDVMSDNVYETKESLANSREIADWLYNANSGQVLSFYAAPYAVIGNANIVLRDADKFANATNQGLINRLKGQAYAIRAMAHFDLFRYFATTYDRNSTTDLALAYSKEFLVSTSARPTRISNKEYYDALFADINQAISLLGNTDKPVNIPTAASAPFIDQMAAYALLARVNLYAGQWNDAINAATTVINNRPLLAYNQAAFSGMYTQANKGEIIWNVQNESGQGGPTFLVYFPNSGRNPFRPAPEVATAAGNTGLIRNNDVRYSAFFSVIGGALSITKYRGKVGIIDGVSNVPVFRTGEMYLIRAEARARTNQEALALADYNALRTARINGYVPEVHTGTALLTAIADERRRELFGEGHRFFDLKRTTRTITRGIVCGNTNISPSGVCSLAPTAREWAFPIPFSVLNANEKMKQNPGY